MGSREVVVKEYAAESIASIAFFIESKGMPQTAERFANDVYDFLSSLGSPIRTFSTCRDPNRALLGYKCIRYKKKYTIVFMELHDKLVVTEFVPSKLIFW